MIIIHALLAVQPDKRAEFLEHAKHAVEATRAEEGNLGYRLVEDLEYTNLFVMIEKWVDKAAVEFHQRSPHFIGFVQAVQGLLRTPLDAEVYVVQDNGNNK